MFVSLPATQAAHTRRNGDSQSESRKRVFKISIRFRYILVQLDIFFRRKGSQDKYASTITCPIRRNLEIFLALNHSTIARLFDLDHRRLAGAGGKSVVASALLLVTIYRAANTRRKVRVRLIAVAAKRGECNGRTFLGRFGFRWLPRCITADTGFLGRASHWPTLRSRAKVTIEVGAPVCFLG